MQEVRCHVNRRIDPEGWMVSSADANRVPAANSGCIDLNLPNHCVVNFRERFVRQLLPHRGKILRFLAQERYGTARMLAHFCWPAEVLAVFQVPGRQLLYRLIFYRGSGSISASLLERSTEMRALISVSQSKQSIFCLRSGRPSYVDSRARLVRAR